MIITKTPFRISFVGGGSDLEAFYRFNKGAVLSTSINKFMYIASHNFFDTDKIRIKYSESETVLDVSEIKHPIVAEVLKKFHVRGALEISSNADIPSRSGLGSSSAFTVGMLHNLYVRNGQYVTKERLSEEACDIEINKLGEPIGKQDQYAAAFGGLNVIEFNSGGTVSVEPIHLRKEVYLTLQENLLMFFIGNERKTSTILSEQKEGMKDKNKIQSLKQMVSFVYELRNTLYNENIDDFGKILHENWLIKKDLASKISKPEIDNLYEKALKNGATGGKLLGAGGGGFLLFYVPGEKAREKLRAAMQPLRELSFRFENEGSKLIYIGDEYVNR